jgi:hypothetical protein
MKGEASMIKRSCLSLAISAALVTVFAGIACAEDYPIMDMVANKVVQKYQTATCEQLWENKGKPKSEMEQKVIQLLRNDPQMRQAFIDKIAAPVANKMFECGMIP